VGLLTYFCSTGIRGVESDKHTLHFFDKYNEHDQSRKCYMNGSETNYTKVAKKLEDKLLHIVHTGFGPTQPVPSRYRGALSDNTTADQGMKLKFHLAVVPRLRVHGTVLHSHLPVCLHGCTSHSVIVQIPGQRTNRHLKPFQSRDAIWHHTSNSVLHMLQFLGTEKG
jgi:hypothetical protein